MENCNKFWKNKSILKIIEAAKKNMYSKDTWMNRKVTDVNTGQTYTFKELDELLNN